MVCCSCCMNAEYPDDRCHKLRQHELWSFRPIFSPRIVAFMYLGIGVLFIILGAVCLAESSSLYLSEKFYYDQACPLSTTTTPAEPCKMTVTITKDIPAPVYLYYGIEQFFQNHRQYVKSISYEQLRGTWPMTSAQVDLCDPIETDPSLISGLNPTGIIIPCGLQAWSVYNDSLGLCAGPADSTPCATAAANSTAETSLMLAGMDNPTGIAWDADVDDNFKPGPTPDAGPWTAADNALITSEDFIVWMRPAAFRTFVKPYRIIEEDLPAGEYTLAVVARFPVSSFEGRKFVRVATTGWYGTQNAFLGAAFLATAGVSLLIATTVLVFERKMRQRLAAAGDGGGAAQVQSGAPEKAESDAGSA